MLTVQSDKENDTEETNRDHYNLGMLMMAAGVGVLKTDDDRARLLARCVQLDFITEGITPVQFAEWLLTFGVVRTNVSNRTDAEIAKLARKHYDEIARRALRAIRDKEQGVGITG